MTGWEVIKDDTHVEGWEKHWTFYSKSAEPGLYELVVTKTPAGDLCIDWLEPNAPPFRPSFSENLGRPQFWMPLYLFNMHAPGWASANVEPLTKSEIAEFNSRKLAHFGVESIKPDSSVQPATPGQSEPIS